MDKMTIGSFRRGAGDKDRAIPRRPMGFSLVELLTVMGIICLLAIFTVPAISSILRGSNLNRAGQMIEDQFSSARQIAVSKNRDIEVRFYYMTNGMFSGWRGLQLWLIEQTPAGPATNMFGRVKVIPDGILMSTNLSPLITASPLNSSVTLPSLGPTPYRGFRFRASGSLENSVGDQNYVTLVNALDLGSPPKNYYTIQINPLTGKASVYRP